MSDEANHALHCAHVARAWASEETGERAESLLIAAEIAEREAIAIEAGVISSAVSRA